MNILGCRLRDYSALSRLALRAALRAFKSAEAADLYSALSRLALRAAVEDSGVQRRCATLSNPAYCSVGGSNEGQRTTETDLRIYGILRGMPAEGFQ